MIANAIFDETLHDWRYCCSDKLFYFHERLKRRECNKLFRCRFYGNLPSSNDAIFMERKTHHESWANMKSVKERFDMPCKAVRPFLDGEWDIQTFFDCKVKSGALNKVRDAQ